MPWLERSTATCRLRRDVLVEVAKNVTWHVFNRMAFILRLIDIGTFIVNLRSRLKKRGLNPDGTAFKSEELTFTGSPRFNVPFDDVGEGSVEVKRPLA